jgi:hypothetical protein
MNGSGDMSPAFKLMIISFIIVMLSTQNCHRPIRLSLDMKNN